MEQQVVSPTERNLLTPNQSTNTNTQTHVMGIPYVAGACMAVPTRPCLQHLLRKHVLEKRLGVGVGVGVGCAAATDPVNHRSHRRPHLRIGLAAD